MPVRLLWGAVIPPFHTAVDRAITYLDPVDGMLGVTDFYVPSRYDLPLRQMSWIRRFFWRCALTPCSVGQVNVTL